MNKQKSISVLFALALPCIALLNCRKTVSGNTVTPAANCGSHNGNPLILGTRGGCYYINSNGNATYVDRSECRC